jgi:DNA primase
VLDDSLPKYLNSPDTIVFNKNRNLFALNIAKRTKQGRLILAEGYMDVISLHQAGFDCAVASLGTSLTEQQAVLISRYTKQAVIAYDSDKAGVAASQRAITILNKTGIEVKVLRYTGAKDPDEFIKTKGRDAFENLLNGSENHIAYRMGAINEKYDLALDEQRVEYIRETAEYLARLNPAEREVYGARAAEAAGISPEAMAIEIKRAYGKLKKQKEREEKRKSDNPSRMVQPRQREIRYENVVSARAEEGLLSLLLSEPEHIQETVEVLSGEDFSSALLGRLFVLIADRWQEGKPLAVSAMAESFSADELSHITGFMNNPLDRSKTEEAVRDYIGTIRREKEKSA